MVIDGKEKERTNEQRRTDVLTLDKNMHCISIVNIDHAVARVRLL